MSERLFLHKAMVCEFGTEIAAIYSVIEETYHEKYELGLLNDFGFFQETEEFLSSRCSVLPGALKGKLRTLINQGFVEKKVLNGKATYRPNLEKVKVFVESYDVIYCQNKKQKLMTDARNLRSVRYRDNKGLRTPDHLSKKAENLGFRKYKTYLMIDEYTKLIKIGRSVNLSSRERTLLSQAPKNRILFVIDKDIESKLHDEYSHKRQRGEWFKLSIEEVVKIADDYGFEAVY